MKDSKSQTKKKSNKSKKIIEETKNKVQIEKKITKKNEPKKIEDITENINERIVKNNLFPILIFSLVTSLIAILLAFYYSFSSHSFVFSGFNDYISIDSGLISTNHQTNAFEGNNISYINEEDIMVYNYEIGYYVKVNDYKTPIITTSSSSDTPKPLREIINSIVKFSFIEPAKIKKGLLDQEAIELINDGKLYFLITYDTMNDGQIVTETIELRLNVKDN